MRILQHEELSSKEAHNSKNEFDETLGQRYPLSLLIVEDHPINRQLLKTLLSKLGYPKVLSAENGMQALEMVQKHEIDLIFMDIRMPQMDGLTATVEILKLDKLNKKPIIVAMTADAIESEKEKCLAAGMSDYLTKPILDGMIETCIQKWGAHLLKV